MSPASSDRSYQPDPPVEMLGRIKLQALHTAVVTNNGDEEPLTISGTKTIQRLQLLDYVQQGACV